jgi:hypothetical protein
MAETENGISRDAVVRELGRGGLEEWACPGVPLERGWHAVGRAGEDPPPTAKLFLAGLALAVRGGGAEPFRLAGPAPALAPG